MTTTMRPPVTMDVHDLPCDLRIVGAQRHVEGFCLGPLDLEVPQGSIVGLIGQNGAGKTTLMKAILGLVRLDGGHVELFGSDTSILEGAALAALKERVGFVSAVTAYPKTMTVAEVSRTFELAYPRFDKGAYERLAGELGLAGGSWGKRVKNLSRGMGMKLQLACALSTGADLLVLDEPTAGLDPIVREEVLDLIRTWMETDGRSVLVSSHITYDLDRLADYLVLMDAGRVLMSCERDEIAAMGVARLRSAELDRVLSEGVVGEMPFIRRDLSCDLLVPDRASFLRTYPDLVCDPATTDDVMVLLVKGVVR